MNAHTHIDVTTARPTTPQPLDIPRIPRKWGKALGHFRKLVANKEDTAQVFHITNSLNGTDLWKSYNDFIATPEGRARYAQYRSLPPILDDRELLGAMPKGSLADHYIQFMDGQGLTAQGLVDEFHEFKDQMQGEDIRPADFIWYNNRLRDTHDMLHVLTGYSRDALGETCVLAYSYQQHRGLGIQFIAYMGALEVRRWAPKGAPVIGAIREAARRGKAARNVEHFDLLDLLPRPLEEVREMLNVTRMTAYPRVHEMMLDAGLDPFEAISGPMDATAKALNKPKVA